MTSIELQSNTNIQLAPRTVKKKLRSKGNTISVTVSEMCQLHVLQTTRKPEEGK